MLTTVHHEINPLAAHVVRGMLVSEGIPATLLNEHHATAKWPMALALGQVQIQVPSTQATRARAVLADWRQGVFERALTAQFGLSVDACPRCGAPDWRLLRTWPFALTLTVLALGFGIVLPPPPVGRRCRACGHRQAIDSGENGP